MDRAAIHSFLAGHRYGVVASLGADGCPQCALVGIALTADMEIVFDTARNSRKYVNLLARPACSMVIGWAGEHTVQLQGFGFEPTFSALPAYQDAYLAAWPDGRGRARDPNIAYLVVRPEWIRYSDYDQSPPIIEEMTMSAAADPALSPT